MGKEGMPKIQTGGAATPSAEELSRQMRRMLEARDTEIAGTRLRIEAFKERIEMHRKKDADLLAELEAEKDSVPGVQELIDRHAANIQLFDEAMDAELTNLETIATRLEEGRSALEAGLEELHIAQLEALDSDTSGPKATMQ